MLLPRGYPTVSYRLLRPRATVLLACALRFPVVRGAFLPATAPVAALPLGRCVV